MSRVSLLGRLAVTDTSSARARSKLTRRRVKQVLADRLNVQSGIFDAPRWKETLKDIISDVVVSRVAALA